MEAARASKTRVFLKPDLLLQFCYQFKYWLQYTVLYFTVLYCTILYCTVLYCTEYSIVQNSAVQRVILTVQCSQGPLFVMLWSSVQSREFRHNFSLWTKRHHRRLNCPVQAKTYMESAHSAFLCLRPRSWKYETCRLATATLRLCDEQMLKELVTTNLNKFS